eukprot:CAMPEP_0202413622 /NCGR_PEP_ID=MMETSP1128-20130828/30066_1 /ASSEMBLY_ACC=CAM_ASM_000463 /TAXON_ID=3047 /ORGANISM="Dunaliella tertiolecta, Strain CCMP1320" /LENGTH=57 /DNA_ID=CAMNT_0049019823 /DNA_START=172 /DNA_END=342 /DNA_ORIENTATION=-
MRARSLHLHMQECAHCPGLPHDHGPGGRGWPSQLPGLACAAPMQPPPAASTLPPACH